MSEVGEWGRELIKIFLINYVKSMLISLIQWQICTYFIFILMYFSKTFLFIYLFLYKIEFYSSLI